MDTICDTLISLKGVIDMSLPIEDADYFIRMIPFPNRSSDAVVVANDDGTYSVYMDSRLDREHHIEGYSHEFEHMVDDDIYRSDEPIESIEKK